MTYNCAVHHAQWTQRDGIWVFTITADRFLRNMVRAVVGTLLEVGWGKMQQDHFDQVLQSKKQIVCRTFSSGTCPIFDKN